MKQIQTIIVAIAIVEPGATDTLTLADIEWWKFYGDSALCDIINRTLEHNRNIRAAAAHIEQLR